MINHQPKFRLTYEDKYVGVTEDSLGYFWTLGFRYKTFNEALEADYNDIE